MDADDVEDLREHWPGVVAAYENAVEDAEHARSVWVKAGRPLEQQHKNGTSGLPNDITRRSKGTATVHTGSMWAIGFSVSRPCMDAVSSPSR